MCVNSVELHLFFNLDICCFSEKKEKIKQKKIQNYTAEDFSFIAVLLYGMDSTMYSLYNQTHNKAIYTRTRCITACTQAVVTPRSTILQLSYNKATLSAAWCIPRPGLAVSLSVPHFLLVLPHTLYALYQIVLSKKKIYKYVCFHISLLLSYPACSLRRLKDSFYHSNGVRVC